MTERLLEEALAIKDQLLDALRARIVELAGERDAARAQAERLNHEVQNVLCDLDSARAGEARAVRTLERINDAMHHEGSAAQITELIGKLLRAGKVQDAE